MKFTESEFAELAEILITNIDGELLRNDSYNWDKLKQHPSFKTLIDNYEKARKWDLLENAKTHEALVEYPQLQKLRELFEKYSTHSDSNISSFCKQLLKECKT